MDGARGRSRRFHVKSRRGCRGCKARKIKCDEEHPSCGKCVKRGVRCSFADEESSLLIIPHSGRRGRSSEAQNEGPGLPTPGESPYTASTSQTREGKATLQQDRVQDIKPSTVNPSTEDSNLGSDSQNFAHHEIEDLRLMHHYLECTSHKLAASPEALTVWHDLIPPLAFENDYLLHGLLAVSALEQTLSKEAPANPNTAIALRHYNVGLAIYRHRLTAAITRENIAALFVYSVFAVVHVFGFQLTTRGGLSSPLASFADMLALLRGCKAIVASGVQWLEESPYSHLLLPHTRNPFAPLPPDIERALGVLSAENLSRYVADPSLRDAFAETIAILRHTVLLALQGCLRGHMAAAVPFAILMPDAVAERVREEDEMALVLVAHYAVVLHWSRGVVWVKGWGRLLVDTIRKRLGTEWDGCMKWAVEEVQGEDGRRVDGL